MFVSSSSSPRRSVEEFSDRVSKTFQCGVSYATAAFGIASFFFLMLDPTPHWNASEDEDNLCPRGRSALYTVRRDLGRLRVN